MPASESIACGRQFAAPTQKVDRQVATNKMMGNVTRRRGGDRRYESSKWGSGRRGAGNDVRTSPGDIAALLGTFAGKWFVAPAGNPVEPGSDSFGGCDSEGLDVLMGE
jgi:hypothetical protein